MKTSKVSAASSAPARPSRVRGAFLWGTAAGVVIALAFASTRGFLTPLGASALTVAASLTPKTETGTVAVVPGSTLPMLSDERMKLLLKLRDEATALKKKNEELMRTRSAIGPYANTMIPGDKDRLTALADLVADVKGGGIIMDVKGSRVYFETDSELAKKYNLIEPRYNIKEVISYLKSRGIYTMARYIAVKDDGLAKAEPAAQIRNPVTGESMGDTWTDPGNPIMLEYNKQILKDLIATGIDEINFDYIRFPTEYGLNDVGLTADQKAERVEGFLKMARQLVDEAGLGTKLGISTYAILGWDFDANIPYLGQNFIRFAPLVDIISPMAYPASFGETYHAANGHTREYTLVYHTLTGYAKLLGPTQAPKIRPWIQGYSIDAAGIREEIKAVYDAGYCGFTMWNPGSRYTALAEVLKSWKPPEVCPVAKK